MRTRESHRRSKYAHVETHHGRGEQVLDLTRGMSFTHKGIVLVDLPIYGVVMEGLRSNKQKMFAMSVKRCSNRILVSKGKVKRPSDLPSIAVSRTGSIVDVDK